MFEKVNLNQYNFEALLDVFELYLIDESYKMKNMVQEDYDVIKNVEKYVGNKL